MRLFSTISAFALLLLIAGDVLAQASKRDSLLLVLANSREDTNAANTLRRLGWYYHLVESDNIQAEKYANEAVGLSRKLNFVTGEANALTGLGDIYYCTDRFRESLTMLVPALKIFRKLNSSSGKYDAGRIIDRVYNRQADATKNFEFYFTHLKSVEQNGDDQMAARVFEQLAKAFYEGNDYVETVTTLKQALLKLKKGRDDREIADIYVTLGKAHAALNENELAEKEINFALNEFKRLNEKQGQAFALQAFASVLLHHAAVLKAGGANKEANEMLLSSDQYLNRAFPFLEKLNQRDALAEFYLLKASVQVSLRRTDAAEKLLNKGWNLAILNKSTRIMKDYYGYRAQLDSLRGDYEAAYQHYKIHITYRDSIVSQQNERQSQENKHKYESEKNESRIKLLSSENKLKTVLAQEEKQQKYLAYAGIGFIVLVGGYGFYFYQKKKGLQNKQSLMKERLRISRELHDEVGATLSGISMYSHLTKEQMKASDTVGVENSLNTMQQSSAEMVNKLTDIVWLVNPEQDSLEKLVQKLEEYASDMAMTKDMQVKVTMPENLANLELPIESRRNIYLFCKEAINNSVKYSGGKILQLIVSETNGKLEFSISDDGRGFDEVNVRRGNGLNNMQKRADEIGGRLSLQSQKEAGSTVSMQVKLVNS